MRRRSPACLRLAFAMVTTGFVEGGVEGLVGDLRGDHELVGRGDRLGVVALHEPVLGVHQTAVGIGDVPVLTATVLLPGRRGLLAPDLPAGSRFLGRTPGHHRLIGVFVSLGLELVQDGAQAGPATSPRPETDRRAPLAPSRRASSATSAASTRQPPRGSRRRPARRSGSPPGRRWQPSWCRRSRPAPAAAAPHGAHREHLPEQPPDRSLVGGAEPGDRGVVGLLIGRDHPERHILDQPPLDPATGPLAGAVGVNQHRQHHRRVVGCTAAAIDPIPTGTPTGRARRPHPARTTPDDPRAASPPPRAASAATARDQPPRSCRPYPILGPRTTPAAARNALTTPIRATASHERFLWLPRLDWNQQPSVARPGFASRPRRPFAGPC